MSLIRDPFGEISWLRIVVLGIMVLLVLTIIYVLLFEESLLFSSFEEEEEPAEVETVPLMDIESEGKIHNIESEGKIHINGQIFGESKACGEKLCVVVRADDADYFVHYDRSEGVKQDGELVLVVGRLEDDIIVADSIFSVQAYNSYTIG